jgi:hypothetical protein
VNHIWSYAGDEGRADVSATFLQPFVSYITKTKTTFTFNAKSTYDWEREQWNVPLNFIVSQLVKIGDAPVSIFAGGRYYVEDPDGGPEWGVRAGFTLLFPAK